MKSRPLYRLHLLVRLLGAMGSLAALMTGCAKGKVASKASAPSEVPVEVATIERQDLSETVNLVGSIAARESARLRSEISGVIREIAIEEGQPVRKGLLLIKLDDAEIAAQAAEAKSDYELAELTLRRNQSLAGRHTIAQSDLDRYEAEFRGAKARLDRQQTRLAKTEIRAPFDGVVGARALSPGDYVTGESALVDVYDLSRLKIEFDVPERALPQVRPGTKFRVLPLGSDPVAGEVFFVSAVIARETRSGLAKGYLIDPPPALRPGMFANVELVLAIHPGVLVVPESAILVTPTGAQIVVARKQADTYVADFVAVRLGLRSKGLVEITPLKAQVSEHDAVVASGVGAIALYPGSKIGVKPLRKELRLGE